jgi:hypothetical protein
MELFMALLTSLIPDNRKKPFHLTTYIWKEQIPVTCHMWGRGGDRSSPRKKPVLRKTQAQVAEVTCMG